MEKFEHPLLIVDLINALFGPLAVALHKLIGKTLVPDHHGYIIPPFMAMVLLIVIRFTVLGVSNNSPRSTSKRTRRRCHGRGQYRRTTAVRGAQGPD